MKKQIKKEPKRKIPEHLDIIKSDIQESKNHIVKSSTLGILYGAILAQIANNFNRKKKPGTYKYGSGIEQKFTVEDYCIQCGICAQVCPVDNIIVDGAKPIFKDQCMSCSACTHNCPKNAIRLKGEISKSRYRNSNVSLKEIISANK